MNSRSDFLDAMGLKLAVVAGLLVAGCVVDGDGDDTDSDTETSSTTNDPTTNDPTTNDPTTETAESSSSTSVDPDTTDTDTDATDTDTADETSTGVVGCGVEAGSATWDAPDWDANTATQAAVRQLLADLAGNGGIMRMSEQNLTSLMASAMESQFAMGEPSLQDVMHPGFADILDQAFTDFGTASVQGAEDFMSLDPNTWDPPADGGVWGSSFRNMNVNGLEMRQIVDKGLFSGGAFYWHAATLTEGTIDAATIDQIAYIYGMDASGEVLDGKEELLDDAASYAYDQGFYGESLQLLADAKAYAADPECTAELDTAIQEFFVLWETAMQSRAVYYYNAMLLGIQAAEALDETDENNAAEIQDTYAGALHLAAEGMGLQLGFYGMPDVESGPLMGQARLVADEDLEAMMEDIGVTDLGNMRMGGFGAFCGDSTTFETAQNDLAGVLQEVYPIDAEDIANWRSPTAG